MNKNIIIISGIAIMSVIISISLPHWNNSTDTEEYIVVIPRYENKNAVVVLDSDEGMRLPNSQLNDTDVNTILIEHNWNNWSYQEKLALTNMMAMTAAGTLFSDTYLADISNLNNSENIFDTYIDLMEHAGY